MSDTYHYVLDDDASLLFGPFMSKQNAYLFIRMYVGLDCGRIISQSEPAHDAISLERYHKGEW